MSSLPVLIQERLNQTVNILEINEIERNISGDGTIKFLFSLPDGLSVESVLLKDQNNHTTFCISTQCGCRMACLFCQTGKMGFIRNLTDYEILSQILYLARHCLNFQTVDQHFNIVFMGMGEPLDNYEALKKTLDVLVDQKYLALSQRRITISTCGLIQKIPLLLEDFPRLKLAVSLNSAISEKRRFIMPIAQSYSINSLADVLEQAYQKYHNRITLEYVLIKNFNMDQEDIKALQRFNHKAFHINLIPLNIQLTHIRAGQQKLERPNEKEIRAFMKKLEKEGFCVSRRYWRGNDIQADCGQLFWSHTMKAGSH